MSSESAGRGGSCGVLVTTSEFVPSFRGPVQSVATSPQRANRDTPSSTPFTMPYSGSPSCQPRPWLSSYEKRDLNPWQHKQWCISKVDAKVVYHMEDVLDLYEEPYDP